MRIGSSIVAALAALASQAAAQAGPTTVTGRVTAEGGVPLPGVSVYIPDLSIGSISREDGVYTFIVPAARAQGQTATLATRLVGYRPATAQVTLTPGQVVTRDFALVANPLRLGEVVITGAGTTSSVEKLGSARNNVDSTVIRRSGESNVVQALAAKAPNVNVTQSSGEPGASSYIRMRGLRTVNSSAQPLFVVDGVPVDNSSFSTSNFNPTDELGSGEISGTSQMNRAVDINPNDIENIEILKGPAAAAIYGARAAQGVILITTKKGRGGQTRYSLRSSVGFDDVTRSYPLQRSFGQGSNGVSPGAGACNNIGNTGPCLRSWGARLPAGTPVYDHANEAFDTGITNDNTLTVSGGTDRTTFLLSGSHTGTQGIFVGPNNDFRRTTVRMNASHRLRDNFNVLGNFQYADTRGDFVQRGNNANGLQLGLLRTPPEFNNLPYLDPTTGLHRSYRFQNPPVGSEADPRGFDNPFFVLYEPVNRALVGRVFGNIGAEYQALDWLKFNYTLGGDYSSDERLEGAPQASSDVSQGGRVTEGTINLFQLDHNLTGTANYQINPNIGGTVTLGQNLNMRNTRQISVVGRQLVAPQPFKLQNTVQRDPPIDDEINVRLESYFGQVTLDLFEQLYLTGALRNDGSSTFSEQYSRNWFPKASAAWTFTNYLPNQNILSFGKLRTAYGEAGQEPAAYLTSATYNGSTLLGGIVQGTGFSPVYNGLGGLYTGLVRAATDLRPERTKETEAGFDLGFFKDAADLGFTYYSAITDDVILNLPVAPSAGYTLQAQNAAKFRNAGIEATLNVRPIRRQDMNWTVGLQYAVNKSKVLNLSGAEFVNVDNAFDPFNTIIAGEPVGVFRGIGFVRCGVSDEAGLGIAEACAGQPRGALYIGEDGFPLEDDQPRILGDPNPKWTGGVNSAFTYKGVTLSGLLDIRVGGKIWNGTKGALYSYGTHGDTESRATCVAATAPATGLVCTGNEKTFGQGGWFDGPVAGPGAGTSVPIGENWYRTGIGNCIFTTSVAEPCMEDGGFVRLRELAVAYSFTGGFVERTLGMSSLDLRVAGRNLATWTDYTGYDPETSLGGAVQNTRGQDYFNQPQTRSFLVSVTLNK